MDNRFLSKRNLKFLLFEVFDLERLTSYAYYSGYDGKMFDMVLGAAIELAEGLYWPNLQEMDRNPPVLAGDEVKVHECVRKAMKESGKGGWITATVPENEGGEQLPYLIANACRFIFFASNYSAGVYPIITADAAHLIQSFGSKELSNTYLPKMYAGQWQGTMALTEPEVGSSLSDVSTLAEPTSMDHYLIRGQKIFTSAGDHNGVENIVHLMLARIDGAPPGAKGLSLFVVPKKRIDADGQLIHNDVVTSGIFHKLGYKGCPILQLSIGDKNDCRGYLVGKPHHGLRYMFQMMNEARIGVGLGAAATATAAYYACLEYCKLRRQGRKFTEKDPTQPQIPIIQHADVKRMLLFQRSVIEGSLCLLLQCSEYIDRQKVCDDAEKEKYHLLLEILTPVAKTYPSEMGIQSISQGLQCLGGSGYCDDYPLEQYYRDARINPIHEGTTGIQGIDLLGRKVIMEQGKAFKLYMAEVRTTIEKAKQSPNLSPFAEQLSTALETLDRVTKHLLEVLNLKGPEIFLADATHYLDLFGTVTIAWQWLLQGISAQQSLANGVTGVEKNFYQGKLFTCRYFFKYELQRIAWLNKVLMECDGLTTEIKTDFFMD